MMTQHTLETLKALRLPGMLAAFEEQQASSAAATLSFEERFAMLVDCEQTWRENRRVARLLRGTSRFGAELDSLSDVTAFGVAPALILYLWALNDLGRFGWVAALALAVCCALRLARFNAALDDAPALHHHDLVRKLDCLRYAVRHEENCCFFSLPNSDQFVLHALTCE